MHRRVQKSKGLFPHRLPEVWHLLLCAGLIGALGYPGSLRSLRPAFWAGAIFCVVSAAALARSASLTRGICYAAEKLGILGSGLWSGDYRIAVRRPFPNMPRFRTSWRQNARNAWILWLTIALWQLLGVR